MDQSAIVDQYLRDNKFFGLLVGVWPDQERFTKYFVRFVTFTIVNLSNLAQISRIVVFFSLNDLTDQMPFLLLGIAIILKQFNYVLNENKLRDLLNGIVIDWLTGRPQEELAILELYSKRALIFSLAYKVSIWFSVFMFLLLPALPPILDVVAPLNASRERILLYPSYYFVDEQEYYYPILGHMVVSAFILACVFIACDLNLIHTVQHACALLTISGYRFKHAMDEANFYSEKHRGAAMDKSYARVVQSIDAHKKATEYVKKLEACHVRYFCILIGMIIMMFTVTFVKLATVEMGSTYLTFCAFTLSQLVHLLFLTVMGQFLINSHEATFRRIYEAQWHNGSAKSQALYVLVLRQCLNPQKLTGGGIITLDLNSFVQVLKASFSYYTVFKGS
ncbi:uncharacterized protein LOC143425133 [Xylocopa sonorina]|uniref:uncharacterized protein LOC143425133 n=1 Tax=Xylocopa sonorina TaxID=1818115 RepID=UPI00403B02FF